MNFIYKWGAVFKVTFKLHMGNSGNKLYARLKLF